MNRLPLFGAGLRGKSATVTAQHRINVYANVEAIEDRTKISFYGMHGLVLFADLGDTPCRGLLAVDNLFYAVHRGVFYEINNAGIATARGALNTTTGRVAIWHTGQYIQIADGTNGYTYIPSSTTFAVIGDADYPDTASTGDWQDGYSVVEDGDEFQLSDLDNATSYDATMRGAAESIPDAIVRVFYLSKQLLLFGPTNIEFWGNTGALDLPYASIGGGSLEIGLAAKWSLTKFGNGAAFLGQNRNGEVRLYEISAGGVRPLSTADWDVLVNNYSVKSDATGLAYQHSGHEFYQINFPTAGKSWVFDSGSGLMTEMQSSGGRHRAEIAVKYLDRMYVSDYENGRIYRIDPNVYDENGMSFTREITSRTLFGSPQEPIICPGLWFDFETGVGVTSGQGSNPQAMLRLSKDGGRTFGDEQWSSLGPIGSYQSRVRFGRQGSADVMTFRLRVTDPVKFCLVGEGWVSV